MQTAGIVTASTSLHEVLSDSIRADPAVARFEIFHLNGPDGAVDLFREVHTGARLVGKYYGRKWIRGSLTGSEELRTELLEREFANMELLREAGFRDRPYFVPRPLAKVPGIEWLLLEEYIDGVNLHHAIWDTVTTGRDEALLHALDLTTGALAQLHETSLSPTLMRPKDPYVYLRKVVRQLREWDVIDEAQAARLVAMCEAWDRSGALRDGAHMVVHGDATPEHFLVCGDGLGMIDFESVRRDDPAWDLGYLAAEIKHLFWSYSGDPGAPERYTRHMHGSYARASQRNDPSLTNRSRYYMACGELRIGRNSWLPLDYRRRLIAEAEECWRL